MNSSGPERRVIVQVFADRVVVSSPGLPPRPITLAHLRKGKYRPCSRNPVLAQNLSYFHRIEERGSGFRRMNDEMLNHGLESPLLSTDMGVLIPEGRARAVRYVWGTPPESTDNRPR
jgi:predicted HTH transcriptional regulator